MEILTYTAISTVSFSLSLAVGYTARNWMINYRNQRKQEKMREYINQQIRQKYVSPKSPENSRN